jgi:hypothetical protein
VTRVRDPSSLAKNGLAPRSEYTCLDRVAMADLRA